MSDKRAIRAEAEDLFAVFAAAGAMPVDTDIMLPAGALLDLYGEDIRARAYVTADPVRGEQMLRPDFTMSTKAPSDPLVCACVSVMECGQFKGVLIS